MGTRPSGISVDAKDEDHPHAYGDKENTVDKAVSVAGSSPRVWGQVVVLSCPLSIIRIIPTRMGTSNKPCGKLEVRWDHPHAYGDKTKEIKENSGFAKSTA